MKPEIAANRRSDTFLLGHAENPEWEKAAEQCLQQIGYISPGANLGFLYATSAYRGLLTDITEFFRDETGIESWTGTIGAGICASGKEYYDTAAMAVMITTQPEDSFRMQPNITSAECSGQEELRPWLGNSGSHQAIDHGDPHNNAINEIITTLADRLPGGFLVGGLTSSSADHPQIAGRLNRKGLSGVVFNDRVPVATGLTQGCTPIAGKHLVTECEQNIIISLDDRPALDVLYDEVGELLARDIKRAAGYIFIGLPVPDSDTSDYLVRNLIGIDSRKKLLAIGDVVENGMKVEFCRRDGSSAWDDLRRMLLKLKSRITTPPRGGVYFSCMGRGQNLFGSDSVELRTIRQELGDFPLVGFFANGEISNNRLYGYTGVLTLFL